MDVRALFRTYNQLLILYIRMQRLDELLTFSISLSLCVFLRILAIFYVSILLALKADVFHLRRLPNENCYKIDKLYKTLGPFNSTNETKFNVNIYQ